jgi:hypothetical protein
MADDNAIKFDRTPYTVTYKDLAGETKTIRRVPPPKLHDTLPTDIVTLTHKRNDDFPEGEDFEVKSISPRQPNTLQLVAADGSTTFVEYFDTKLKDEVAPRNGVDPRDRPKNSKYLLWP